MKKLFTAIKASDLETVRQIIEKKPALVNCVARQPPKKDDGQSPLQVALKTGNCAIANYLLDMGADVCLSKTNLAAMPGEPRCFMMRLTAR